MVCIGYPKEYFFGEVGSFLYDYGITCGQEITATDDMVFVEVETDRLNKSGICCFGRWGDVYVERSYLYDLKAYPGDIKHNSLTKEIQENNKWEFIGDAFMWLDAIHHFVDRYGKIGLLRYYGLDEWNNPIKIFSIDLGMDNLLRMLGSQIYVIINSPLSTDILLN